MAALPLEFVSELPLDNLTKDQFLGLAHATIKNLLWNIIKLDEKGFIAGTTFSGDEWQDNVYLSIENDKAIVKTRIPPFEKVTNDNGGALIEQFTAAFNQLKENVTAKQLLSFESEWKELVASLQDPLEIGEKIIEKKSRLETWLSFFIPVRGFFFTPLLIDINIAIFILMVGAGANFFLPDTQLMIRWGANFRPLTLDGEWWRLITCIFLHFGVFHLLMNMYALLYIGLLLEPLIGKERYISAYLITGIASSLNSLMWHDLTVSAGASGAIFGLYGVFLALLTTSYIDSAKRVSLLTSIGIFVVYNLLYGLNGQVDNAAHIGGLISGIIIGYAYLPGLRNQETDSKKFLVIGSMMLILLVSTFTIIKTAKNDIGIYDEKMKKFAIYEESALEPLKLSKDIPKEQLLSEIKDRGIYYWEEDLKLLDTIEKLDLPDVIQDRNKKLRDYCYLRIQMYNWMYKDIDESTSAYDEQVNDCATKIASIISELNGNADN